MLKLKTEKNIELHIGEFEKRGCVLEMLGPDPNIPKNIIIIIGAEIIYLNDRDTRKNEIHSDLKKNHDLDDTVY